MGAERSVVRLIACLILVVALLAQGSSSAYAASRDPVVVDFETLTGPSYFMTADPPVTISGMTLTGGQVLRAATFVPANQTAVYGTANFCNLCAETIVIEFDRPATDISFDLINGETANVSYAVLTPYGVTLVTLAPNYQSGMARITIPESRVLSVQITRSGSSPAWDFFVDNFSFVPIGGKKKVKESYENYKWYTMGPLASANRVMELKTDKFTEEADSSNHDSRLNWSSDLCSGPSVVSAWDDDFADACRRHDFGYRNFGASGALDKTAERKNSIDWQFYVEMGEVCRKVGGFPKISCQIDRALFYDAVQFSPWGHNAFFD